MVNVLATDAWLHLVRIAADAGKYIRTSSHLKPDEAALLVAEISRLRSLAGETGADVPLSRSVAIGCFAHAA